jgi:hypothetical protein
MPDNPYRAAATAAYNAGNRSWLPCPEEFYDEMLSVVPPIRAGASLSFGYH